MKNYAALGAEERQREYKSLHRKLIFPNILILAIAVVAALSLLFGTSLELRVHIDEELVSSLVEDANGEEQTPTAAAPLSANAEADGGTGEAAPPDDEAGADGEGYSQDMMQFMLKGIDIDLKLQIEPKALLAAATADDARAGLKTFFESVTASGFDELQSVFTQMAPNMMALIVVQLNGEESVDYAVLDTQGFADTVTLLNEQKPEEAKAAFLAASASFAADQLHAPLTAEQQNDIAAQFDDFVAQMTGEDGTVNFGNIASSAGQENIFSDLTALSSTIDTMDEETVSMVRTAVLVLTVLIYACAALWALLAVFALLHILLPNKKLGMWYVKLTGFLPCLLLFILPLAATTLLPKIVSDLPAIFGAVGFGSLTFISGICYLAMWVISVFVCHPVKKRIKACKRAM